MQKNINVKNVRVCKESKYIYIKPSKEKIYKNNKYIEMCIKIYKNTYIRT